MTFGLKNWEFVRDLSGLTGQIAASILKGPQPQVFCHYTSKESAEKIMATRTLWATCLTEQSDKTELCHGITLVEEVVMKLLNKERSVFVQDVLSGLCDYMRSRRFMLFITCFCEDEASSFHLQRYGSVRFRFNRQSSGPLPLVPKHSKFDRRFNPVNYCENDQRQAIEGFLRGASILLVKHSVGSEEHDPRGWMASTPRRDIGQCLLTIIASFKRHEFRDDREWRLILSPALSLSTTAPSLIDEDFNVSIKNQPKRHVPLVREAPFPPQEGSIWPPASGTLSPYDDVVHLTDPI